ncbi:hypothetical protein [Streptomyces sp. NRRL S-37]|uniref:hypothetical protein n=1 Tax=Streptomyces sp. NRRL S-37 TaxID=1463903 RepID=UPI0004C5EA52|nr:hypothetical protein [Streptomyces sp. NRRL S-37]
MTTLAAPGPFSGLPTRDFEGWRSRSVAWDERDRLKAGAMERRQGGATQTQLGQYPGDSGPGSAPTTPDKAGDLSVDQRDLSNARAIVDGRAPGSRTTS